MRLARAFGTVAVALVVVALAEASASAADPAASLRQAVCHMVDGAAEANRLPAAFLTRILWQESRFRTDVISPAGAQGVAQFMPQTAAERGLADPYDPGPAIAQAARLLAELGGRFGNLGLATAAYNAGPARVAKFLRAQSDLPEETRLYVLAVTGRPVEDWAAPHTGLPAIIGAGQEPCLSVTADLAGCEVADHRQDHRAALLGRAIGARLRRGGNRGLRRHAGRGLEARRIDAERCGGLGDLLSHQGQPFGIGRRVGGEIDPGLQRPLGVALLQLPER